MRALMRCGGPEYDLTAEVAEVALAYVFVRSQCVRRCESAMEFRGHHT